jgi:hypothetical protein
MEDDAYGDAAAGPFYETDDAAAAAAGAAVGVDDAPSTSLGHHDQGAAAYGGSYGAGGDGGYDDGGDGDGAGGPPPSDFKLLQRALLNERLAPEILPYEGDLVARVREAVEAQVRVCARLCVCVGVVASSFAHALCVVLCV